MKTEYPKRLMDISMLFVVLFMLTRLLADVLYFQSALSGTPKVQKDLLLFSNVIAISTLPMIAIVAKRLLQMAIEDCWFGHKWKKTHIGIGYVSIGPSSLELISGCDDYRIKKDCVLRVFCCKRCGKKRAERELCGGEIDVIPVEFAEEKCRQFIRDKPGEALPFGGEL